MSGRVAALPPNRPRSPGCQVLAATRVTRRRRGSRSQSNRPTDDRDDRSPLPLGERARPVAAQKYQIPNKDRAIFQGHRDPKTGTRPETGIVDFEPIAHENDQQLEYEAWHEVTLHAAQFSAGELEENAGRDPDPRRPRSAADRTLLYRLELLRFDGKLTRSGGLPRTQVAPEVGSRRCTRRCSSRSTSRRPGPIVGRASPNCPTASRP